MVKKIKAKPFRSNTDSRQSYRVIGTTDLNGVGTSHELGSVEPFILLDENNIFTNNISPFPKHPHMGLLAINYLLEGEIKNWNNLQYNDAGINIKGDLCYINSGKGIVHEEHPIISGKSVRWLQLWVLPEIYSGALPKASIQIIKSVDIPSYTDNNCEVKILIGEEYGMSSSIRPDWSIRYLYIKLNPDKQMNLPMVDFACNNVIYVIRGCGNIGDEQLSIESKDCLTFEAEHGASDLFIRNINKKEVLEFIFLSGKMHHKSFCKLLYGGGAFVAKSEEDLYLAKNRYDSEDESFGLI